MPMRKSTKIALGFALIAGGGYYGYQFISDQMIMNQKFVPLAPSDVNLVGVDTGAGYRIIVANYIAQLVETSGGFEGNDSDTGGATEGAIKKRVPIREMLNTLKGDAKALGPFVMTLNEMNENDNWPTTRVMWKAEDLQKALDGDAALRKKLESDLNMRLDGTPLSTLNFNSLENGIVIDSPVRVTVNIEGKETEVVGRVLEPYRPRMIRAVEETYKEKGNVTREMQAGYYQQEAQRVLEDPSQRENIAESLKGRIAPKLAEDRAVAASKLLRSADIVVSDKFITGASYHTYKGPDGKPLSDLKIKLNDEGRRRVWQFSKKRVGDQLLLTVNGIPIAAPRIRHELAQSELTITQMQDRNLVEDAVNMINENAQRTTS